MQADLIDRMQALLAARLSTLVRSLLAFAAMEFRLLRKGALPTMNDEVKESSRMPAVVEVSEKTKEQRKSWCSRKISESRNEAQIRGGHPHFFFFSLPLWPLHPVQLAEKK